jgi:deazaflavin-dependent oxidoreductase (nitroreductase family)
VVRSRRAWLLWNERNIAEFRADHGRIGRQHEGAPVLLLHTVGARSGLERIIPLMYLPDGDRMIVIASKAGSPEQPSWYYNVKANPDVRVEVGDLTVSMTAVELVGEERDRMFAEQARRFPGFQLFQNRTDRVIPVFALSPRPPEGSPSLRTSRLLLRPWLDSDREAFAALNSDPRTMAYFPAPWTREQSNDFIDIATASLERNGFGPWAVEVVGRAPFIGFVSVERVRKNLPFAPAVEVMWRFSADFWGRGYATEAAAAAMKFGFERVGVAELVGFSAAANMASRRMMRRLQLARDRAGDFPYPGLAPDHRLLRHVLYRARRATWPGRPLTGPEWNRSVIREFRANRGKADTYEGGRLLLLTSVGARTGRIHTNPTMYLPDDGGFVVFATSGGRAKNPAWYHNLKAHPTALIEVGDAAFDVTAEEATGAERDRLYARQVAVDPSFAEYEKKTARSIPVMVLRPA